MHTVFLKSKSQAYIHEGGTKYYRIAAVTVIANGKTVNALLTNYGPYSLMKGDLDAHKPTHGGQSAMRVFDSELKLKVAFASEHRKRLSRGYKDYEAFSSDFVDNNASLDLLRGVLTVQVGVTPGHYIDIFEAIEPDEAEKETPMEPGKADVQKEFAAHIEKYKADFASKHPTSVRERKTRTKMDEIRRSFGEDTKTASSAAPRAPEPVIERGEDWGSW